MSPSVELQSLCVHNMLPAACVGLQRPADSCGIRGCSMLIPVADPSTVEYTSGAGDWPNAATLNHLQSNLNLYS